MENGQTTAFDAATQGWDDTTRMRVLEVLHEWGLSKNDPTAVIAVLLGHVLNAGETIPANITAAGESVAAAVRTERDGLAAQAGEFGKLAEGIPARVEDALRSLIPSIAEKAGTEAAKHIDTATADRVADRVGAAIEKREQETGGGITRFLNAATDAVNEGRAHVTAVSVATKRAAILSGFWSPLATIFALALAGLVIWSSYFSPVKYGPVFDAGRRVQAADDLYTARNAPAKWAGYVRNYHGGR